MATAYDTLATEVTARLGNRTDIASRVALWINDAVQELAMSPRFSFMELDTELDITSVANTAEYSVSSNFPGFWFIIDIFETTNNQRRRLKRADYKELDNIGTVSFGQPTRYARFGDLIRFDPTPETSNYTFRVRYRTRVGTATSGNVMPLEREWDEPVILLATIKGLEALDQRDKAVIQRQLLEPILTLREDVVLLEERDADFGLKPVLDGRVYG